MARPYCAHVANRKNNAEFYIAKYSLNVHNICVSSQQSTGYSLQLTITHRLTLSGENSRTGNPKARNRIYKHCSAWCQ